MVTISERSVRTVAFVSETRWSRMVVAGVVLLAQWIITGVLMGLGQSVS